MIKRLLYLGYYIKQMDWKKLSLFLNHASKGTNRSKVSLLFEAISCVFKYNISVLEYFQFRFFEQTKEQRQTWAGTGYMFEYQLQMNPKNERHILDDKRKFYRIYHQYFVHAAADKSDLKNNPAMAEKLLKNPSGKLEFKVADGK